MLITLANLATVNTVYQMRVSAFPVPDSVVMPQTLYMGVLQILSLFNHNDSVLTLVNLLISFAASIVVEGVDVVHKGAFPDVAAAVIGGNHTLQYCSMVRDRRAPQRDRHSTSLTSPGRGLGAARP